MEREGTNPNIKYDYMKLRALIMAETTSFTRSKYSIDFDCTSWNTTNFYHLTRDPAQKPIEVGSSTFQENNSELNNLRAVCYRETVRKMTKFYFPTV